MKRVHWTGPAEWDLQAIDDYWCALGIERADEMLDTTRAAGDFLAGLPEAGPALEGAEARKWRVAGTDYVLIYRPLPDAIQILRVRHAKQDWRP